MGIGFAKILSWRIIFPVSQKISPTLFLLLVISIVLLYVYLVSTRRPIRYGTISLRIKSFALL